MLPLLPRLLSAKQGAIGQQRAQEQPNGQNGQDVDRGDEARHGGGGLGPAFELQNEHGVLGRGHAALEEEDEDEEGVAGGQEAQALSALHHGQGQNGHDEEALEHDEAGPSKDAPVKAFQALDFCWVEVSGWRGREEEKEHGTWPGHVSLTYLCQRAGEDEQDAGHVGGAHGAEGVKEGGQGGAFREEQSAWVGNGRV